jgi:hypothetical protein
MDLSHAVQNNNLFIIIYNLPILIVSNFKKCCHTQCNIYVIYYYIRHYNYIAKHSTNL